MSATTLNSTTEDMAGQISAITFTLIASRLFLALAIFMVAVILALVAKRLIARFVPRLLFKTAVLPDEEIARTFSGPVRTFLIATGGYIALKIAGLSVLLVNLDTLFFIVLILVAAYQTSRIVCLLISWCLNRPRSGESSEKNIALPSFLDKFASVIIYAVALGIILAKLGVSITPVLASLGVVGIVGALAAQSMLSNFFGALAIFTDKHYKTGDRIELPGGEFGDVLEIGLRSTRILTLDHRVIVVPNANISSSPIKNFGSKGDKRRRFTVKMGISYDSDLDRATQILLDITTDMSGVLKDPPPSVYVEGLRDSAVNLVMHVWGEDFRRDSDIPDRIYLEAIKRFREEGIKAPYPQKNIIMTGPIS